MPSLPLSSLLVLLPILLSVLPLTPVEAGKADREAQSGLLRVVGEGPKELRPAPLSSNALVSLTGAAVEPLSKEDRQARRLLRKKKKRLRELREEIRRLARPGSGLKIKEAKLARSRDDKWRRRMLARMDTVMRKLGHLESLIVESSPALKSLSAQKSKDAEAARKMDRHLASVSRSLSGEAGTSCASHRDCRPGRCCHIASAAAAQLPPRSMIVATSSSSLPRPPHKDTVVSDTPDVVSSTPDAVASSAAAVAAGTCVQHDAVAGVGCADSCQCTAQLLCFVPKAANETTAPACKRAASSDILTGTYLNDPSAIF